MKEDILEQLVDDFLHTRGYFTRHNVRFQPYKNHPDFTTSQDSVPSDIDILGMNPHKKGSERVWAVSCKSWQAGFRVPTMLTELKENKIRSGRESWKFFRELIVPKWSEAFCDTVFRETGSWKFTHVIAVTRLSGDPKEWQSNEKFIRALRGNPLRLISLSEMVTDMLPSIKRTPSGSDLGRTLQLLLASGILRKRPQ